MATAQANDPATYDAVNSPRHYKDRVPGIECIDVTEHFQFCRGNAIKYLWRAGLKGETNAKTIEDLSKAIWYIEREIRSLEKQPDAPAQDWRPPMIVGPVRED